MNKGKNLDLLLRKLSKFAFHHTNRKVRQKNYYRMIKLVGYDYEGLVNYAKLVKYLPENYKYMDK